MGRDLFCFAAAVVLLCAGRAADTTVPAGSPRDTLVYKDGDRVQGKLVERAGGTIVFQSDRFGVVRVPVADATVVLAEKPAANAAGSAVAKKGKAEAKSAEDRAEEEQATLWERLSPAQLTAKVREFFGPWHGKLAFATEVVSDTTNRRDDSFDGHLQRKWGGDDVQLNAHYDYAEASQIKTTDLLRASASWRHDFDPLIFAQYRPSFEWNRASVLNGVPNDYVLLQQEIGVGFNLVVRPGRKVSVGVSENLFDVWNSAPTPNHTSRADESLFEEAEWALPWRMKLTQRGVWYPLPDRADGWEEHIELNKKLTETLSVALRHEMRRNNPDGSAQDYTRLKLMFGLDF